MASTASVALVVISVGEAIKVMVGRDDSEIAQLTDAGGAPAESAFRGETFGSATAAAASFGRASLNVTAYFGGCTDFFRSVIGTLFASWVNCPASSVPSLFRLP